MNIIMMTNTFTPHLGGVARSVEGFTAEYRKRGHRVLVIAPEFEAMPENEVDVIRIPAIQRFNGSDFSVVLPIHSSLTSAVEDFSPDIIHSHHPFLLGGTALRIAHIFEIPLVFTHHTRYEQYTHYVPGDSELLKRFVVKLAISYADLCDQVFAPSESLARILVKRGVIAPIAVVPTGVHCERFSRGSGPGFREAMDIPVEAFVVGHLGRLAPEKNIPFLTESVASFLKNVNRAHFLVIGKGPSERVIREIFNRDGLAGRLHHAAILDHPLLASAYRAMDVFAFASKSETQGMVLTEAMAAGVPVIALDAPGVREVVVDYQNGRLLQTDTIDAFVTALQWAESLSLQEKDHIKRHANDTAEEFSMKNSADKALELYRQLMEKKFVQRHNEYSRWTAMLRLIKTEWDLLKGVARATAGDAERDEEG